MLLDMCLLTFIAYRYKYINVVPKNPKMEDFVTTETDNSIATIPNQQPRKPSATTIETIEMFIGTSDENPRKLDWNINPTPAISQNVAG